MTPYLPPGRTISFGDIFDLSFLYDVHVRADAVALGSRDLPAKAGGGRAYANAYPGRQWVLARGELGLGILISDNCLVDTALGQDRGNAPPKGRLLFAPVTEIPVRDLPLKTFGRFALPRWDGVWEAASAELRRCFMVDARDVAGNRDKRRVSLGAETAEQLEIRWSAYAARRGPLSSGRNCEKLAEVLARELGDQELTQGDRDVAFSVAAALATAWRVEGSDLEAVSDAYSAGAGGLREAGTLLEGLRGLATLASQAADLLDRRLASQGS